MNKKHTCVEHEEPRKRLGNLAAGSGLLPLPCCFKDTPVDEVCALIPRDGFDDGHYLLSGIEEACLGVLLLAACAFAGPAPLFPTRS